MTREEAIKELEWLKMVEQSILEADISELGIDSGWIIHWKNVIEALDIAIKALEQEPFKPMVEIDLYSVIKQKYIEREVLDKIRAEIIKYEGDCRLSVDEYPSCKQCTDNVFESIYAILDKYKAESENKE